MTQPDLSDMFVLRPTDPRLKRPTTAAQRPMAEEMTRRTGNALKVLQRLQAGPATNRELAEIAGYRFGPRISELRADGWDIPDPVCVSPGLYRYELLGIRKP